MIGRRDGGRSRATVIFSRFFQSGATFTLQYDRRPGPPRVVDGLEAPLPFSSIDDLFSALDNAVSIKFNHVFNRVESVSPYFCARELSRSQFPMVLFPKGWRRDKSQRKEAYQIASTIREQYGDGVFVADAPRGRAAPWIYDRGIPATPLSFKAPTPPLSFETSFPSCAAAAIHNAEGGNPLFSMCYNARAGNLELWAHDTSSMGTKPVILHVHPRRYFKTLDELFTAAESLWYMALREVLQNPELEVAFQDLARESEEDDLESIDLNANEEVQARAWSPFNCAIFPTSWPAPPGKARAANKKRARSLFQDITNAD